MKIVIAEHAGFCFGVKRAVDTVSALLSEHKSAKIYTLGDLIHNPHIIDELAKKGVASVDETALYKIMEEAKNGIRSVVVIRTHGVARELEERLRSFAQDCENFALVDCTCPFVKKIHKIAKEQSAMAEHRDAVGFVFGDASHPEVAGIRSYFSCPTYVFADAKELELFLQSPERANFSPKCVIFVSQTTQKLSEFKKSQEILKKLCTNPIIFDTICSVTEDRQLETDRISRQVNVMLVIGGRNSSNTQKLYGISQKHCERSFYIESVSDLPLDMLQPGMTLGITAGASTPRSIIEEVNKAMTEEIKEESFAEMLDESFKTLNTGDVVKGIITSISNTEMHVDIGGKVTGILPFDNIIEDPDAYHVGDEIEAIAVRVSDIEGTAILSKKKIDIANNWQSIVEAYENGTILSGKVVDILEKGVIIMVDGSRIFIPASHSGLGREADLNTLRGTTQRFKIIDLTPERRRAVGSIREILRAERKEKEAEFWEGIEVGKTYEGVVKSFMPYGAFVDLGGVDGMVHTSELSWCHIKHPSDVVALGETIQVYVKDFDAEKRRISLGYKTEDDNPWKIFVDKYQVGSVATVKIANMTPFGAFAEIIPGVDGLIHISQIADKRIATPAEVLEKGQEIDAKIIGIDEEAHKVSLSIRALIDDVKAEQEEENLEAAGDVVVEETAE